MYHPTDPSEQRHASHDLALEAWQRRKWLALGVFVVCLAGATTAVMSLPDLYRARASVLVARQQVSEAYVRSSVTAGLETRIQTIDQQVRSRARLGQVIAGLGLYPELRGVVPFDALIERMRRDFTLELKAAEQMYGGPATTAFTISYIGRNPDKVAEVANTLAALYVEENTKSREQQASRTASFLKEQLAAVKRELDAQEQRTRAFRSHYTSELPQQLEANLAALERLNTQLRLNGEYQIRVIERSERLERQLAEARTAGPEPEQVPKPVAELAQRRDELADLRRRFSDAYPDVIRVKGEVAALEQQVAALTSSPSTPSKPSPDSTDGLAQAIGATAGELASLKQEESFLRQVIASYESRVENAPRRQQELQDLSRDHDATRQRYEALLKQYEDAQLAATLEQGQSVEQFRILDSALPPTGPSAPNRLFMLLMGLLGSVAAAFAAIVAAEKLDTTFHTVDDLRAFAGLPTLATIRLIVTPADVRRRRYRLALLAAAVIAGVGIAAAGSYYLAANNEQLVRLTARGA